MFDSESPHWSTFSRLVSFGRVSSACRLAVMLQLMWCPTAAAWAQSESPATTNAAVEAAETSEPDREERAYDRVVYGPALPRAVNPWNPAPAITLVGKIQKLNQQVLEIQSTTGQVHKLSNDRIELLEVAWASPAAAAAHARFAQQQYTDALKQNDEILRAGGIPLWQQCVLLSELVESAEAAGKPELAGKLFLLLVQQSPPDYLIATIPLNWTSRELTPPLEKAAREWLAQSDEYAGLLGASWLLLTDQSQAARQRLQRIQASESKLLQRLATMQLWRATPPSETTGEMARWIQARDSLALPLQLGPTEFLAERYSRVDKTDLAIGEWLRIAATYRQHPYRAGLALEQARMRLERDGDKTQAERAAVWLEQLKPQ
jgi:hypothetical protein